MIVLIRKFRKKIISDYYIVNQNPKQYMSDFGKEKVLVEYIIFIVSSKR